MKYLPVIVLVMAGVTASTTPGYAQIFRSWSIGDAQRAAGQQLFKDHCAACHAPTTGTPAFGPSLVGVVGRPAGTVPGFPYSDALKNSGITWTEDNLRKWIADNSHLVPHTLMPHVSLSDPAEQIYVISYLRSLSEPSRRR